VYYERSTAQIYVFLKHPQKKVIFFICLAFLEATKSIVVLGDC